jgi:predicted ester cyclase
LRDKGKPALEEKRGPASFKSTIPAFRLAFPDGRITVDEVVVEADRAIACWIFQGTHQGKFLGIAPTGKQITYSGVNGFRIKDNQLVASWDIQDSLNLFQQLEILPETAEILGQNV